MIRTRNERVPTRERERYAGVGAGSMDYLQIYDIEWLT